MTSKYTPIAKEDTYKLIEAAQRGDRKARELIVDQNIGLVKNLAMKYASNYYEPEDLMQIGFIGLVKAIDRFDCEFDVMFSTYAVPMILGEIKRFIRDDGKIKVSRQLKIEMRNLKNIRQEYYNKYGTSPKISYLASQMETSAEHVMEILEAIESLSSVESLDNPLLTEGGSYVDEETRNVDIMDLKTAISKLEERERQIIVLRYFKDMTQQQIAKVLGISQVQVSRIEKKVLKNMREKMENA
ncbi:MAG: sigma-70 family RNA polymerase sigma factor [Bacillota bacterium]|nr:sigma-70 family RNA polymerase sigma factor [Bacillota bacterium]